jgi:hypothetical protein
MLDAFGSVDSTDGWFGLALAALNVVQTLALAYMARRSARVRRRNGDGD